MELKDCIEQRYSVRDYEAKEVEKDKIERVLEAARLAPSAVNLQPWTFVVITHPDILQKIRECYTREWIQTAPAMIIACGDHTASWKRRDGKDYCDVDLAIAIEHICLSAVEEGLGTCWVCNFDESLCKEALGLPKHIEPVAIIPIGYPIHKGKVERKRKSLNEIVRWEKYS